MPPSQFESGSAVAYGALILAGTGLIGLLPAWLFLRFQKPSWKTAESEAKPSGPTPTTPPPHEPESDGGLGVIYWIIGGVVVVLAVIGLIAYSGEKKDQEAQDKAQQLTQKFERAGLPVPEDQDIIVSRSAPTAGLSARTQRTRSARRCSTTC